MGKTQCLTGRNHCWEHLRKGPRTKLASDPAQEAAMAKTSTTQRAGAAPSGPTARTCRLVEALGHQCRSAPCRRNMELGAPVPLRPGNSSRTPRAGVPVVGEREVRNHCGCTYRHQEAGNSCRSHSLLFSNKHWQHFVFLTIPLR